MNLLEINNFYLGDALELMSNGIEDNSVDLIITSPPYAERRKKVYGGVPEEQYVEWFKPIGKEIYRILKPTGSFFLNIKPHTEEGERSLYVFELVLSLKNDCGFKFIDEFCWTKNAFPGGLKGRFKNGFEPIYHFTKRSPELITFNPLACGTPIKEETLARANRKQCGLPENGSGMAALKSENLKKIKIARPSNVIHVNNVSNQFSSKKFHSATFPLKLVEFFIKSFSNEGDLILDPFAGRGTTGLSAKANKRNFILFDKDIFSYNLMKENFSKL